MARFSYGRVLLRRRWWGVRAEPEGVDWQDVPADVLGILRGPLRHAPHYVHGALGAYHFRQPRYLFWWIRLSAWAFAAVPLALFVAPALALAGPVIFEVALYVMGRRRAPHGTPPQEPPGAGVREPRRPKPDGGAVYETHSTEAG
jgi:hypothetical protein